MGKPSSSLRNSKLASVDLSSKTLEHDSKCQTMYFQIEVIVLLRIATSSLVFNSTFLSFFFFPYITSYIIIFLFLGLLPHSHSYVPLVSSFLPLHKASLLTPVLPWGIVYYTCKRPFFLKRLMHQPK